MINHIYEYDFYELINLYNKKKLKDAPKATYKKRILTKILAFIFSFLVGLAFIIGEMVYFLVIKPEETGVNKIIAVVLVSLLGIIFVIASLLILSSLILTLLAVRAEIKEKNTTKALKLYKYNTGVSLNFAALKKIQK
ncbi:hypothetical protein [Mycoplasmopsis columbina]|uniref:Transmembrane protein n=1 Tax=Mycoplasmopsis columbina SF7 TaxID=1037410 RepID=F9UJ35_9BACT|nr:hypothetical protein [Mycoplasmopsis columbina]EGV00598.1 hypothetical protein MCSF7_00060 [Mycoplasmopsis columbina SF7]VEU76671.1 Uncharacterised protein [Mycoplasmopsis columbina]